MEYSKTSHTRDDKHKQRSAETTQHTQTYLQEPIGDFCYHCRALPSMPTIYPFLDICELFLLASAFGRFPDVCYLKFSTDLYRLHLSPFPMFGTSLLVLLYTAGFRRLCLKSVLCCWIKHRWGAFIRTIQDTDIAEASTPYDRLP